MPFPYQIWNQVQKMCTAMPMDRTRRPEVRKRKRKRSNVESGKRPPRPGTLELNCLSAGSMVAAQCEVPELPTNHQPTKNLLHVKDVLSGIYFLVDTGAEVSIVPPTGLDRNKPSNMNLIAANGSRIKSYGTRHMAIQINHFRYRWKFQIADPYAASRRLQMHS